MLPPKGPGERAVIASKSGATARVPRKGSQGQFQAEFFVEQVVATVYEVPDPNSLGQRLLWRTGEIGRGKAAKVGYQNAHGEVPCRLDALYVNGEGVAWLCSLYIDRSGLRIKKLCRGKGTAREIFFLCYPAFESIVRVDGHPLFGFHLGYRLPIWIEDVAVVMGDYFHRTALIGLHLQSSLVLPSGRYWSPTGALCSPYSSEDLSSEQIVPPVPFSKGTPRRRSGTRVCQCSLSCFVMHTTISIPQEGNIGESSK